MNDSANNSTQTQALQAQSKLILPLLTNALSALDYHKIAHQRISESNSSQISVYQGLTCAQHSQFGQVMIKWQLSPKSANARNNNELAHEIKILKSLNSAFYLQQSKAIAPPLLAYDTSYLQILEQSYQLTILVMSFYPLGSLAPLIYSKNLQPLADKQKRQLILQVAQLIANLHNQGWLHNDLKPSNILLANNTISNLILTDFSLAEYVGSDAEHNKTTAGTPAYLAPERWRAERATVQSDIYAFGIIMYEILLGARPFKIAKQSHHPLQDWAVEHCQTPIPKLAMLYEDYQAILDRALAKRVENRYQTMEEILKDLS